MKKIVIIFVGILLFATIVNAETVFFPPPGGGPPTYDWVQGSSSGTKTTSIGSSRIYLTMKSAGSKNYVVTDDPINLTNYSYISIEWKGQWISWNPTYYQANITFGVASTKMDDSFDRSVVRNSSNFNSSNNLDVHDLTGEYYLKVGGEITKASTLDNLFIWIYNVTGHGDPVSVPYQTPSPQISTTAAVAKGHIIDDSETGCVGGFWIGNQSGVTEGNALFNITAPGTFTEGHTFTKVASGLTSGEYYYIKSWCTNGYSFTNSTNETYILTKPDYPLNFQVQSSAPESITLSWTNRTFPAGTNSSTYIRYSNTAPGGTVTTSWGTFGANTSAESATINGLNQETTYYFVAWTYINASGSPTYHHYSDSYSTTSGSTEGGIYDVLVFYENESIHGNLPVDLSKYGPHRLILHYTNGTDEIVLNNPGNTSTVVCNFSNLTNGKIENITVNKTISFIEFHWNDTVGKPARCNRIIIPQDNEVNISFYIRTDLPVYGESSAFLNDTLVRYTYNFVDQTSLFGIDNDAYAIIFTYNSEGDKLIIHSEYIDTFNTISPWLVFEKKYYIGVRSDAAYFERIGLAPTDETTEPEVLIIYGFQNTFTFFDLIDLSVGWYGSGLFLDYLDTTFTTGTVNFSIYYYNNQTLVYSEEVSVNNYNFTYECNTSVPWLWSVTAELEGGLYDGNYSTGIIPLFPEMATITSTSTFDKFMRIIWGPSPIYNVNTGVAVPQTYIILAIVAGIWLLSFSRINAVIGGIGAGVILTLGGVGIAGLQDVLLGGAVTAVIGIFIIALSIVAGMGGAGNT